MFDLTRDMGRSAEAGHPEAASGSGRPDEQGRAGEGGRPEPVLAWMKRNALIAVAAAFGFTFAALISEAVVTETVFSLPGIGRLVVQSILRRDYPVIQGVILVIVVLYMVINLLVDLAYARLDPRVSLK